MSEAAAEPQRNQASDAKERFAEAVRFYKEGDAARALPLFEALLDETGSPNANLYVGHCLVKLGRYVEAYRAYSATVSAAVERNEAKYEQTKEAARAQLATLDLRVARLVVVLAEVPDGIQLSVDGEELDAGLIGTPAVLEPGDHVVEATADGMEPVRRKVRVEAGETKTLALALRAQEGSAEESPTNPPAEDVDARRRKLRTFGYVGVGIGIVGISTFAVAGLRAKKLHDDLEDSCGEVPCADATHRDQASQGKTMQSIASTGLVIGAAGAIAGGTLLVLSSKSRRSGELAFSPTRGGGTLTYRGAF